MLYNAQGICKAFRKDMIIDSFQISLEMGDFVAIAGKRGSGLTTVTQLMAGLIKPTEGEIYFEDELVGSPKSVSKLTKLRRNRIGYVATEPVLVSEMTVYDNLLMGMSHTSLGSKAKQKKAKEVLNTLGLKGLGRFYPNELTLVEKQKVCIGRAMMTEPDIIILDEPTDVFDSYDAEQILEILEILNSAGYTIVVSTHSKRVAARTRKVVPVSCEMDVSSWNHSGLDNTAEIELPKENPEEKYLRGEENFEDETDEDSDDAQVAMAEASYDETDGDGTDNTENVDNTELENEILSLDFSFYGSEAPDVYGGGIAEDPYDKYGRDSYADDDYDRGSYADAADNDEFDSDEYEEELYEDEPLDEEELSELENEFIVALSEEDLK